MPIPRNMVAKVADEVWIAIALLHLQNPKRSDFTVQEIAQRAREEALNGVYRHSIYVHAFQHCVANLPPNRGRYRMLYATGKLTRRLYRPGDTFHPGREGGKQVPAREEIPEPYHRLLDWYFEDYAGARDAAEKHSLLVLRGMGKEMWAGVDPDEFVRRLREGWK